MIPQDMAEGLVAIGRLKAENAALLAALVACVNLIEQTATLAGGPKWMREWGASDTLAQARAALAR